MALAYVASYGALRALPAERWDRDGRTDVIYPEGSGLVLYYLWRPVSYADAMLTGAGSHIGPHR